MNYKELYEQWLNDPIIDEATKAELRKIAGDEKEIEDRFYRELEFGTGGLRGVIGAGTNRLNIYTIRKATQGLANYILQSDAYKPEMGVAIAHDCRRMSPEFSTEAALVLNANGIKTYTFESLRPTPLLSFAVRHLGCVAGIVVTASHNPPEYNGYKVYWSDGGQCPYPRDEAIIAEVQKVTFANVKTMPQSEAAAKGLFNVASSDVDDEFIKNVKAQCLNPEIIPDSDIKIVFTPLHGAGNEGVQRALREAGFKNVFVVKEQEQPDGNFPTVSYPNPEDKAAFECALKLAREKDADLIVATDPDCDRVGIAVKEGGDYQLLTGNMTGVILTEYMASQMQAKGKLPANGAIISTIVSTDMTREIAKAYGLAYMEVLTGFKYIGEKIKEFEKSNSHTYILGFEESYGYLAGTYARDKDAVVASLLICEAAAYYRKQGLSLYDALQALYKKYDLYRETIESITLKGVDGLNDIKKIMSTLRKHPPKSLGGSTVKEIRDYKNRLIINVPNGAVTPSTLPVSDVLYYATEDGSWACVRPSGTEPKIKLYFGAKLPSGSTTDNAIAKLSDMNKDLKEIVEKALA
ncbi:MAG: phospho-sugar mutase [Clostridiales bacterium]|jgi:phosphoglucomutase|nr:phospho-sugar mutase [Clostridiales bacterium]